MTQALEGSGEFISEPSDINLISGAIDRMYDATRELDPVSKLRAIKSLGHIAAGVLEYSEAVPNVYPDETDKPVLTPVEQPTHIESELSLVQDNLVIPASEVAAADTPADHPEPQLHVIKDAKAIVQNSPEVDMPETDLEHIKLQFPELKLTDREAQFMKILCGSKGAQLRKGDLCDGILGSSDGVGQSFRRFILKLEDSNYAEHFSATGKTVARRYRWNGPGLSDEQSFEPESITQLESHEETNEAEDDATLEIDLGTETAVDTDHSTEQIDQSRDALLIKLGLSYSEEYKSLSVKGINLRLNQLSVKVLLKLAERGGSSTYRELVNNIELMECDGSKAARELSASILEITTALTSVGVHFKDRPLMENGKKIRKLELGDQTPSPQDVASGESPFLAHGLK